MNHGFSYARCEGPDFRKVGLEEVVLGRSGADVAKAAKGASHDRIRSAARNMSSLRVAIYQYRRDAAELLNLRAKAKMLHWNTQTVEYVEDAAPLPGERPVFLPVDDGCPRQKVRRGCSVRVPRPR